MIRSKSIVFLSFLVPFLSSITTVYASDETAKAKLEEARALYAQRSEVGKIDTALTVLAQAETEAQEPDLKFDILLLGSKSLYWKGMHTAGDDKKMEIFEAGKVKAEAAMAVNSEYADAYYWKASNLGRWAEAKGILASLAKKQELIDTLEAMFDRNTRDGQPGDTYEGYGADRILGRMYFKLPSFAGGSLEKSNKHLEAAYTHAKDYALTVVFYAETVFAGSASDKARARQMLDELLSKDPLTYNPARIPETIEEFADARKLRNEMGG